MKIKNMHACVWSLAAAVLGFSSFALAQEEESIFEEIIVTATKRAQNIYEVPIAISALLRQSTISANSCRI